MSPEHDQEDVVDLTDDSEEGEIDLREPQMIIDLTDVEAMPLDGSPGPDESDLVAGELETDFAAELVEDEIVEELLASGAPDWMIDEARTAATA